MDRKMYGTALPSNKALRRTCCMCYCWIRCSLQSVTPWKPVCCDISPWLGRGKEPPVAGPSFKGIWSVTQRKVLQFARRCLTGDMMRLSLQGTPLLLSKKSEKESKGENFLCRRKCIAEWCNEKPECPLCRAPITHSELVCLYHAEF
jgi:hypothetical protein